MFIVVAVKHLISAETSCNTNQLRNPGLCSINMNIVSTFQFKHTFKVGTGAHLK